MKSSHIVGIGRLATGALEGGEGREQLHTAGLIWSRAAPVCMLLRDRSLGDQSEHTFIHRKLDPNLNITRTNTEAEDTCLRGGVTRVGAGIKVAAEQQRSSRCNFTHHVVQVF